MRLKLALTCIHTAFRKGAARRRAAPNQALAAATAVGQVGLFGHVGAAVAVLRVLPGRLTPRDFKARRGSDG